MGLETDAVCGVSKAVDDKQPKWGYSSRFFIPNEDARVVCDAIAALTIPPRKPLFVGGSGMVLLEAMTQLPKAESVTFVDISPFQVNHFCNVLNGVDSNLSADDFRRWFILKIYPMLRDHFVRYKNCYFEVDDVIGALHEHFGLDFFFKKDTFMQVKSKAALIKVVEKEMSQYLLSENIFHDFIYLSNIADYLSERDLTALFTASANMGASIYLLLTQACKAPGAVADAWQAAGYAPHDISSNLTNKNKGLGSRSCKKGWNRRGVIHLLVHNSLKSQRV